MLLVVALSVALGLSIRHADSPAGESREPGHTDRFATIPAPTSLGGDFYAVTVDGMDCIVWKQKASNQRAYGGLSCDWTSGD